MFTGCINIGDLAVFVFSPLPLLLYFKISILLLVVIEGANIVL